MIRVHSSNNIPDDPCVICLGDINNTSTTNVCKHRFCFECIQQWSKVSVTCPLCKRRYTEIFYDIKEDNSHGIVKVESPVNKEEDYDFEDENDTDFDVYLERLIERVENHECWDDIYNELQEENDSWNIDFDFDQFFNNFASFFSSLENRNDDDEGRDFETEIQEALASVNPSFDNNVNRCIENPELNSVDCISKTNLRTSEASNNRQTQSASSSGKRSRSFDDDDDCKDERPSKKIHYDHNFITCNCQLNVHSAK